jgi:hypothetical protein
MKDINIKRELPSLPEKGEYKQRATVVITREKDMVKVVIKQEKT